ncbi:nicotinate-nucleotide diphosphorylase (carboxylating) [Lottiidibacillus patelloidae]|uniref:Probable nicotinate-nucleotide pyrophosphorylase [carboxylating] n=1 Tax=Lottiidibacillus patelloidae TaxID=2670334 RepID=A0A263BVU4_9BACI|nr:carboxylating nicotinate-nucleotide diphosphorylase [Lottiidibacillus patelloidae]OZM57844.1 nicotinate-nucleotide diphosphorylase (carboxylating) [Lottiidibacillus patelloidae]
MDSFYVKEKLKTFFHEDINGRDLSSEIIFQQNQRVTGEVLVKEDGIFSGQTILEEAFKLIDETVKVEMYVNDGDNVKINQVIALVEGPIQALLKAERVMLNLIQRMSGIATLTKQAVATLDSEKTRVCDTRKTTPGLRAFEKYAVTCGGGYNHRFGLYDGVMLKDNHIAAAGSIMAAVQLVKNKIGHMVKVEVETETTEQVIEAVEAQADIIMFDNCTPEQVVQMKKHVPKTIVTEVSGGITLENIASYRDTEVDYISLGFITHSAKGLDISFNIKGGFKA